MSLLALVRPLVVGCLVAGAAATFLRRDAFRWMLGLYLGSSAINLVIFWSAGWIAERPPIAGEGRGVAADPLVQALVLTGIVITVGTSALLAAVVRWVAERRGSTDVDELDALKG